jgi:transposase
VRAPARHQQAGDVDLRQLLIHGTRAVLCWVDRKEDPTSRWATALKARRHTNVAVVALANKIARVAYAVMATGKPNDPSVGTPLQAAV